MSSAQFLHILSMKKNDSRETTKEKFNLLEHQSRLKKAGWKFSKLLLFLSFPYYCGKIAGKYQVKRSFNFLEDACLKILISLHLYGFLNLKSFASAMNFSIKKWLSRWNKSNIFKKSHWNTENFSRFSYFW